MGRRRVSASLVRLGRTIRAHVFRTPVPEEVDEEFAFHVEMRIRQHLGEGMSLDEARAAAIRRFGDIEAVKQVCRRFGEQRERMMTRTTWMAELGQDLRLAVRQLRRSPGFALAAVLTLGLGMGANTAVFSVVNGVLLTPLPFPESDRLVEVRTRYLPPSGFDIDRFWISAPELLDLRKASRSFEALGLYSLGNRTLAAGDEPVRVPAVFLDRPALEALGVQPAVGRWFTAEEDRTQPAVGLLGHDLWVTRFGADPSIIGTTIETGGTPLLVTGVMPEGFVFPNARYQVFENSGLDPADPGNRSAHGSLGIGQLAAGVTMESAVAELQVIQAGWAEQFPHNVAHFPIYERLSDNLVGTDVRRALLILVGAVAVVLLIAAANVANLLLARGEGRLAEVAVRRSMGASGGRIARQLLTEGLVLSVLGALTGLVIGELGLDALLRIHPEALPRAELIGLDGSVMMFTAGVTVATALLFGLAPALAASRAPAASLGAATTRGSSGSRGPLRFRRALVASEVGLSLVVVLAAGLIGSSFGELTRVDPGVDVEGRLVFGLSAAGSRYAEPEDVVGLFESLRGRLTALPGVTSVSAVSHLPLSGTRSRNDFVIDGRPPRSGDDPTWSAQFTSVLPGYFETMGIEATAGRLLGEADGRDAEPVVVVSRDVVDEYFDGANPVGERIALSQDSLRWARIVGVVPRTRTDALDSDVIPQVYLPHAQGLGTDRWTARTMFFTARTAVPPASLMAGARAAVREVDAGLPVTDLRSMQQVFDASVARPRFMANLLGAFALIALALAAVGIYGVVSYSVSRRTREIGIRMALGARGGTVFGLVMREGATPAVAGVLLGLPVALLAAGILDGVLYQVSPRDPAVFGGLSGVLVALAVLSSWLPARRAARLAPREALEHD